MTAGPHLTPEGISAAVEGLLSEADQRAAEAHLAGCERCQSAQEELVGLRSLLRQAGAETPRMPDVIAHRLDSALAAESAERSRQTGVLSLGKARRSKHAAEPSKARRRLVPALAAAAGVAAIAVGGTLGYQVLMDGGRITGSTAGEPNAADAGPNNSENRAPSKSGTSEEYEIASSPRLTADGFDSEVRDVLRPTSPAPEEPSSPRSTEPGEKSEGLAPMQSGSESADRCAEVAAVESGAERILDVERATFDGKSALLAIAESNRTGTVDAYVVTGCPDSGSVAHHDTVTVDR